MKNFQSNLKNVIVFVFDHEREFMEKFIYDKFPNYTKYLELDGFYMASSQCLVQLKDPDEFENAQFIISTDDVLDWYNSKSTN